MFSAMEECPPIAQGVLAASGQELLPCKTKVEVSNTAAPRKSVDCVKDSENSHYSPPNEEQNSDDEGKQPRKRQAQSPSHNATNTRKGNLAAIDLPPLAPMLVHPLMKRTPWKR
jgi:hypothetical protein